MDTPSGYENRPMNCLTWYDAMAFCAWDGGYLPTEAEWNYAATGGNEQRAYPWSTPSGSLALDSSYANYCVLDGMGTCQGTVLMAVGTQLRGDGRWGQSDLAGNVAEWVLDWYANYVSSCVDCAELTGSSVRGIRGGGFDTIALVLRAGHRNNFTLGSRFPEFGVRCARRAP